MKNSITAIILTFNEEKHIERCINSIKNLIDQIVVVDSQSTDNTVELAKSLGAKVFTNPWKNYASQFNWALQHTKINTEWVWRIDADEYIEPLTFDLKKKLENLDYDINGIYLKRKIVFMGKPLLHGGWFPVWHLKLWRHGKGICENRWMDEHIKLFKGNTTKINCIQVDENLNDTTWWTEKHNSYATREMIDSLDLQYSIFSKGVKPKIFGNPEQRKRWLKLNYLKIPYFIRPIIHFFYSYFFRFGFLDGRRGFIWHVLQGFWYRFLVDVKIFEIKRKFKHDKEKITAYIKQNYQIKD